MARIRQDGAVKATVAGIVDRLTGKGPALPLSDADRLDGKTALVTGANRGLGKAVAVDLARRGARVLVACRSGLPEAAHEVTAAAGAGVAVGEPIDLSDLDDVARFCDRLRDRGERIDVAVLNAGVVPARARRTKQGFEEMFAVNYLANVLLVRRLLADGTIPNATVARGEAADPPARIVFVSSESHRSAPPVDPATLGRFEDYDMRGSVGAYGRSKLLLETFAAELARRLAPNGRVDVAVLSLCPGAVRTGIAREAPWWAKPLLGVAMQVFFRPPEVAARPVVYLAGGRAMEGRTGVYLHVAEEKPAADAARDPDLGRRLWDASDGLLGPWRPTPRTA